MKVAITDIVVGERQRQDLGDIESLAGSLARLGQLQPIILDESNNLIAGERRMRAAMYNGWGEIEAIRRDDIDEITAREIELEENLRRKELFWTEEVRAVRDIFRLRETKYGTATRGRASKAHAQLDEGLTGYTLEQAAEELERGQSSISLDIQIADALDEYPDLSQEKTKAAAWRRYRIAKETALRTEMARRTRSVVDQIESGEGKKGVGGLVDSIVDGLDSPAPQSAQEVFALSKVRKVSWKGHGMLYLADARDVLRSFPEGSIDLCVTDPPFGLGMFKEGTATGGGRLSDAHGTMYDDDPHVIMDMLDQVFGHLRRVVKPDGQLYVFFHMTRYEQVYLMLRAHFGEDAVDETPIVWIKNTPGIGDPQRGWVYAYEPFFWVNRGKRMLIRPQAFNYLKFDTVPPGQKIHPMAKPPALLRHIISASSVPGEVVLDPFAGSGSTLVAASQAGCRFVGIEKHEPFHRAATEAIAEAVAAVDDTPSEASGEVSNG